MKSKIYRAGLIPYIITEQKIEMLFMKPANALHGGNHYQIAKGKLEEGENFKTAAIREAQEELGFTTLNSIGTVKDLGTFLGRTRFFIVEVKDKDLFTDHGSETEDTKWFTLDEFLESERDLHKPIVKAASRLIKRNL